MSEAQAPTAARAEPSDEVLESTVEWSAVAELAAGCTRCALHAGRSSVVFGDGDPSAPLILVGTAPGRHEDLQGRPFVGALGNLIDTCLREAGSGRDRVYLTTVVKCRPPEGRDPRPEEVASCSPYLRKQVSHVAPKVVVTLGSLATRLLLRRPVPVERVAGYRFDIGGGVVAIPTYDPLAALQGSPHAMEGLRRDVRTAVAVVDGRLVGGTIPIGADMTERL